MKLLGLGHNILVRQGEVLVAHIRRRNVYRAIAILAALLLALPLVAVEVLYRIEISQVHGRPQADRVVTVSEEKEISECFHFDEMRPLWPWTLLRQYLFMEHSHKRDASVPVASIAARTFLFKTQQVPIRHLAWQMRWIATEIWISRNMTRTEAIASLGMAPAPDMRIDLLAHDHICSKAHWRALRATMPSIRPAP